MSPRPASVGPGPRVYCFHSDVLSAVLKHHPLLHLIRCLARLAPEHQLHTAITVGELLCRTARTGNPRLVTRACEALHQAHDVIAIDEAAAEDYGTIRARLEAAGQPLDEPDLRIAAIALTHGLTLVTGNLRHFSRVPDLKVENWLTG